MNKVRVIAYYLPQFHPIPENDKWWGKGFTEWTNVGKAKPLFRGHYQPKVPADLGYYDLRLPEVREAQAEMAKEYGVEGFCYWHYWFGNGKQLLERPFNEVLASGKPDFPFCLAWANHSWEDKTFNSKGSRKILIKQEYPGDEDYKEHFLSVLPAFLDRRYIRVDNKPIFVIYSPDDIPNICHFLSYWRELAQEQGFNIHFIAHTVDASKIDYLLRCGFDGVNVVRMYDCFKRGMNLIERANAKFQRIVFRRGRVFDYKKVSKFFLGPEDTRENCYPTLIPNWDHSPRSGRSGHILINSTPDYFYSHAKKAVNAVIHKSPEDRLIFLKSWNEWGEGNYIEPDLKYGRGFLEKLKKAIS